MPALHAVLIGINNYHPGTGVSSLQGCLKDVANMHTYLEKRFGNQASLVVLTNETATRQGFIDACTQQFINNKNIAPGDVLLLYYSGHGSYASSNTAFTNDAEKRDETFVLYDSRLPGNYDLADKEMALLLAAVRNDVQMIVVADSCHAGSVTRFADAADRINLGRIRHTPARESETGRPLESYLKVNDALDYTKMNPVQPPASKHILLAACSRSEPAYETGGGGGLFTNRLLELLDKSVHTYASLYEELYTAIKRFANKQSPQLKSYGGADINTLFLDNKTGAARRNLHVYYSNAYNKWVINAGALHGLENDAESLQSMEVELANAAGTSIPQRLQITGVGLEESLVNAPGAGKDEKFAARIINKPPDLAVLLTGSETEIALFSAFTIAWDGNYRILYTTDAALKTDFVLGLDGDSIVITKPVTGALVTGIKKDALSGDDGTPDEQAVFNFIVTTLEQLAKWNKLAGINNPASRLGTGAAELVLQLQDAAGVYRDCPGDEITIELDKDKELVPYTFSIKNKYHKKLYAGLYQLTSLYGISRVDGSGDVDASALEPGTERSVDPEKGFYINRDAALLEDTDLFKLVVCEEVFTDQHLMEPDLVPAVLETLSGRFKASVSLKRPDNNWAVRTITVRLVWKETAVNAATPVTTGIVTVGNHPNFKASLSLNAPQSNGRNVNPVALLQEVFGDAEFELINLAPGSRSAGGDAVTVLELSGIEQEAALENQPLAITVRQPLQPNEQLIAVTADEGIVMPLGWFKRNHQTQEHTIELTALPVLNDTGRSAATRNPIRALWCCFLKVVLKQEDGLFKLRQIYYKNGDVKYTTDNLPENIKAANHILVLVHGIIGNTKSIATNLEFLLKEKRYDLVLGFDYENLNTSIDSIADELKKMLEANGISASKRVDVLAHSMGGLVSRSMIEQKGGDKLVRKLMLFGTPGNGSAFGHIVTFQDWATGILTLVCNFGKKFVGPFGPFLEAANKIIEGTEEVTITLGQMRPNSAFIKKLNTNVPVFVDTEYHVVAGDVYQFSAAGGWVHRMVEKIKRAVGKVVYGKDPNDIAVEVDSILFPKTSFKTLSTVACHHLNYFEEDAGLKKIEEFTA